MDFRKLLAAGLVGAFAAIESPVGAQEPPKPEEPPPAVETPAAPPLAEEPAKKSFWGDRFALYLEAAFGSGEGESLDSSLETLNSPDGSVVGNNFEMTDVTQGRLAVGWKLPEERGGFRLVFNGHSEESYELRSKGLKRSISTGPALATEAVSWWDLTVTDGNLGAQLFPPIWLSPLTDEVIDPTLPGCPDPVPIPPPAECRTTVILDPRDDTNENLVPDLDEVHYDSSPSKTTSATVPGNAQNRVQTWDALFMREFGGRRVGGGWSCGLRYLVYDGNVPAAAWLNTSPVVQDQGFTDGVNLHLISMNQETRGWGPTGSLDVRTNFFKRRLTLYGQATFAFLQQDLTADSGDFFTIVRSTSGVSRLLQVPARLTHELQKSAWNLGAELGGRFVIVQGLHVELAWSLNSYGDAVLLPFGMTIPATDIEAILGTVALYQTKDIEVTAVRLGLGYQF